MKEEIIVPIENGNQIFRTAKNPNDSGILTTLQPRPANEIWVRSQWVALAFHLHNSNPTYQWVMGFFGCNYKNGGRPETQYRKSKKIPHVTGIPWAWTSLCNKGKMKISFTPYSQNNNKQSRWGLADFDAHTDDPELKEKVQKMAFSFFLDVLNIEGIHVLMEASGRGWHIFLISKEFRSVPFWYSLILSKLKKLGIDNQIDDGLIEVFPRTSENENEFGYAVRAPGSWHPKTQQVNQILWENVTPLLDELVTLNIERKKRVTLKEKKDCFSRPPLSSSQEVSFLYPRLLPCLEKYAIAKTSTRNNKLKKFVGELFHKVSLEMAERFIREQYKKKHVTTEATEQSHLEAFGKLWAGLQRRWLCSLSESEAEKYSALDSDNEQDAFRIIHSYSVYAQKHEHIDFAIGRDDLGARLGISGPGSGKLIRRFIDLGILKRTREYSAHKFAARYVWLLDMQIQKRKQKKTKISVTKTTGEL